MTRNAQLTVNLGQTDADSRLEPGQAARVLIIDDSLVLRSVVERIISTHPALTMVASLSSADQALTYLRAHAVDIIILDVEMPSRCGLDALPDLIAAGGSARVLVLSSQCAEGAPATLRALALGASDTLAKPGRQNYSNAFSAMLVDRLTMLKDAAQAARSAITPLLAHPAKPHHRFDCLGIGASTGGISAIHALLKSVDACVDAPILITQHLPAIFMPYMVSQINDLGMRPAHLALDGAPLLNGHIYCAPGDAHLRLHRRGSGVRIRLVKDWPGTIYKPSVDPMFMAMAECFGARCAGVLLSGMGNDGLVGAQQLAAGGAPIYAQDAQSSTVWGMPGAVARAGIASVILPPGGIAASLNKSWKEQP